MTDLVDSHVHLDLLGDADGIIASAVSNGVRRMLAVGCDLRTSRIACEYAREYSEIFASIGIHPHNANSFTSHDQGGLLELARFPSVVAVGETGLDYYRDHSPREQQQQAFKRHIELARQTGLTLVVHAREAARDTLKILAEEALDIKVVLHCFALTDYLQECIQAGYFMSFAGNVTYKKASALRDAVVAVPSRLLLTETDSPYLAPVPHRGDSNRPEFVRPILYEIASLRDEDPDDLAATVKQNFNEVFGITSRK